MKRYQKVLTICGMAVGIAGAQPTQGEIRVQVEEARDAVWAIRPDIAEQAREAVAAAKAGIAVQAQVVAEQMAQMRFDLAQAVPIKRSRGEEHAYREGQRALDRRRWEDAAQAFTEAAAAGGTRADGALYWKAYSLAKLGRRDESLAAIAEMAKAHPQSRWLSDARALEIEVKQASGQPVSPEQEGNEDIKLMALNGLMNSDPDRALPLIENLLKTSTSPRLKERALFVLAQSNAPRGRQIVEQVARGSAGNPDLQLKAIEHIASQRPGDNALFREIYGGTSDEEVKRAVLRAFMRSNDREQLLQVARTEKSPALRMDAISWLASNRNDGGDALVTLYGSETDPNVKRRIVGALRGQNNAKALVDIARKETDPAMKREIVQRLSQMKSKEAADYLMELLK